MTIEDLARLLAATRDRLAQVEADVRALKAAAPAAPEPPSPVSFDESFRRFVSRCRAEQGREKA